MTKFSKIALCALLIGSSAFFTSCEDDNENTPPAELSIYEQLGGTRMVVDPADRSRMIEQGRLSYRSVVDSTVVLIVADILADSPNNLGEYFAPLAAELTATPANNTNLAELSKSLTDFFSANTGGGATNTYSGLDMVAAHNPNTNPRMGATADNGDYDQFVAYVVEAAGKNGVTDQKLIGEIGAVLESLRAPIVQDPS